MLTYRQHEGEITNEFDFSHTRMWHDLIWRFNNKNKTVMVRAKFYVTGKTETNVELSPVTSGSEENALFFQYTPYGELKMGILNDKALSQFNIGDEFYVDFTKVG